MRCEEFRYWCQGSPPGSQAAGVDLDRDRRRGGADRAPGARRQHQRRRPGPTARDAASDGWYPLISNDRDLTGAQLLAAYKYQPNLEKRHAQLKGTQLVAPVFLHDPARIEALLCCQFIAMLIQALIERQIRQAMKARDQTTLALPRRPRLPRAHRRPHPRDLHRAGTPPPHRPARKPRADLPPPRHRATSAGPRPARHPAPRLHNLTQRSRGGAKRRTRSAENGVKRCPSR